MLEFFSALSLLAASPLASAAILSIPSFSTDVSKVAPFEIDGLGTRDVCSGNTASDRSVWCDYDISTNYYDVVPDTGVTVEYWFELTNITASPDGYARTVLTVNGSIPGTRLKDTIRSRDLGSDSVLASQGQSEQQEP